MKPFADSIGQAYRNLDRQIDDTLRKYFDEKFGEGKWTVENLAPRGQFGRYPDGSQIFQFDGVPIFEFGPVTMVTLNKGHGSIEYKVRRDVRKL